MPPRGPRPTSPVGVKDVARLAGVSLGTVSNVLNRPDKVGAVTRERVQRAIAELGFVRNEAARQLRSGRSRVIGQIVLDVANPFFTDLATGVEAGASAAGLAVMLCNSAEDRDREARYLTLLEEQRAFGILITPVDDRNPLLEAVRRRGTSVVLLDRGAGHRICSVAVDDQVGGRLAVAHLTGLGHRHVAFVGGPLGLRQVHDRLAGARAAATDAATTLTVVEVPALTVAAGRDAGHRIARTALRRRPTAVCCANDLVAVGVLQALAADGIAVPGEISVVGYDDIEFAAASTVPLTSVRQPREQLGRAAAELLIDEVTNATEHRHRQVVFAPDLVVRESTAAPAGRARSRSSAGSDQPAGRAPVANRRRNSAATAGHSAATIE